MIRNLLRTLTGTPATAAATRTLGLPMVEATPVPVELVTPVEPADDFESMVWDDNFGGHVFPGEDVPVLLTVTIDLLREGDQLLATGETVIEKNLAKTVFEREDGYRSTVYATAGIRTMSILRRVHVTG